jgi:hypothetical protein
MKQKLAGPAGRSNPADGSRTSFSDACEIVMKLLAEQQRPYSISGIARESKLHRKTVEKCIGLLASLEANWLDNYRVTVHTVDKKRIVTLERRSGMLSYPAEIQRVILRAQHFPMPSDETYVLINLYLHNAKSEETAKKVQENKVTTRLVKQGQVIRTGSGFYLSKEGITISKGALELYPFLEQHKKKD